jgi:DNA mismatch repair protein MutL
MISPKSLDEIVPPSISFNPDFNPFSEEKAPERTDRGFTGFRNNEQREQSTKNWGSLYEIANHNPVEQVTMELPGNGPEDKYAPVQKQLMQLHNKYIISQIKSGLMLIDQQAAHERILYERFSLHLEDRKGASQQSLFPQTVTLSANDYELAKSLLDDIKSLGFEVREFGKNTLVIEGIPVDLGSNQINETQLFEHLIEGFKNSQQELKLDKRDALARSMARNSAIKSGVVLGQEEMNMLIEQLFACKAPNFSISGKPVIQTMSLMELDKKFDK